MVLAEEAGSGRRELGAQPEPQPVEIKIDDRSREQRECLAHDESADNGHSQWTPEFGPGACTQRQRQSSQERGHGGHHDRPEAQHAGFVDRLRAESLPSRSVSSAKSIIMIAFFFTMPISRMMPINRHHVQLAVSQQQGEDRAHASRRQGRKNRDGMNVALIEHAEHDVDRDQRGQNQQGLAGQRRLESRGGALKAGVDGGGKVDRTLRAC